MARPVVFSFPAASTTAICTAQTTAGAGALSIDGSLLDLAAMTVAVRRVTLPGIQRTVSLTSAGDVSAANITITGTNLRGAAVTETRAGPNATTVYTTAEFASITSVTTDAALGTAMSVGTGSTGQTNWWKADYFPAPVNIAMEVAVTATANVTVYNTLDNVETNSSPVKVAHGTLASLTSTAQSNYVFPPGWVQAVMNSSSGSGAFTFTIIQAG